MNFASRLRRIAAVALLSTCSLGTQAACLVTTTSLAFGSLQALVGGTAGTSTATVSLTCVALLSAVNYTIAIGPSSSGALRPRAMTNVLLGGPGLAYDLYLDPSHTSVWGNGATGAMAAGSAPAGTLATVQNHVIYGKLAAQQPGLRPGAFSDSLVVTVTYDP